MKTLLPEVKEKLWKDRKIEVSIETLEKYIESLPTWLLRAIVTDFSDNSGISLSFFFFHANNSDARSEAIDRICYLITSKW